MVGRGVDLETAVAVKDLALRMGNASVYKEGGIAGEDCPNHLKLTDVDEVWVGRGRGAWLEAHSLCRCLVAVGKRCGCQSVTLLQAINVSQ